ncbi:CBS domain-containing protein (plasmid) [Lichenicola cladoniae]|uniref:CBS domain-containing protein n=1 Tax=Lichenicola cladoniae TaxID=1484109 RepID=A0A6M8HYL4_9PROT|nr:CBS domain-containing protein [Lichenicola cladoniae]NPD66812.1 CBS domain-containing protein [Acetobacteraceae bacterium]QKE93492.1 CBS domain-containing protein [Lichenicola cladoniae]
MLDDASAIMTREVYSVTPDATIAAIARVLATHDISAVPVCDQSGVLVGLVSEGDLLRPFGESNRLRRAWWLSLIAEGNDLAPEFTDYVRQDHRQARDVMTTPVITAPDTATLPQLSDLLTRHRIKRLPILRNGRMVGIVSRADLVRAISQMPANTGERTEL